MWKCQGKELGKSCKSVAKELQNDCKSVKKNQIKRRESVWKVMNDWVKKRFLERILPLKYAFILVLHSCLNRNLKKPYTQGKKS